MPSYFTLKLITSPRYHVWNDTLHARALARNTQDKWYRGTYVRWTVTTSWNVLEMCCRDAMQEKRIGNRFKEDLDLALSNKGFDPINWGRGIWQEVLELKELRKKYTHIDLPQDELWPEITVADKAIQTVRNAVKDIYRIANSPIPQWIDDDEDGGWR